MISLYINTQISPCLHKDYTLCHSAASNNSSFPCVLDCCPWMILSTLCTVCWTAACGACLQMQYPMCTFQRLVSMVGQELPASNVLASWFPTLLQLTRFYIVLFVASCLPEKMFISHKQCRGLVCKHTWGLPWLLFLNLLVKESWTVGYYRTWTDFQFVGLL